MRVAVVVAAGATLLVACGRGEAAARRARQAGERARLEASLDRLEARLLEDRARVRLWAELRERHGQVAAVACEVNGRHAAEMARVELQEHWRAAGAVRPWLALAPEGPPSRSATDAAAAHRASLETDAPPPPGGVEGSGGD